MKSTCQITASDDGLHSHSDTPLPAEPTFSPQNAFQDEAFIHDGIAVPRGAPTNVNTPPAGSRLEKTVSHQITASGSFPATSPGSVIHPRTPFRGFSDLGLGTTPALQDSPETHISIPSPEEERYSVRVPRKVNISVDDSAVFDFYLEQTGVWLDIVSPDQCFAQAVPRLALSSPVLYYSCLAYAARALHLRGRNSRTRADYYHGKAIGLLIPLLDSKAPMEILLATTVLLRMSEQFSEPEEDAQCHMNGAFSLFASSESQWPPDRVDVQGVAFWIFVRQSLRICFLFEQECRFDLSIVDSSKMLSPARDEVWTNRMTYLLAKVCSVCWTSLPSNASLEQQLDALETEINSWRQALPETFKPWYYHHSQSEPFPTIRYLSRWHAIGWQQYYTAKTMLAVYRQKYQVQNTYHDINSYLNLYPTLQSKVLVPARLTCGVVFSDKDIGSNINGAHLAYWCGQFFTGREEQRKMLEWLKESMERVQWPNRTCIERLQKVWGRRSDKGDADRDDNVNSPPFV
ncbi:hypothetical protein H2200_002575 [Cladophialophora chaetospira]|uniref:Transcription factor domain-containing protein n=1 Tax=Cladophialophora chaetospira TaxID=386627 RepID=A0AA39CN64_9EURO|nr:hypothetical protein H2200_002575 [Cladophialophora chaetospira]